MYEEKTGYKDNGKIYQCCKCGNPIQGSGPINTYLKMITSHDRALRKGMFEVREGGEDGFSAQFNVLQNKNMETITEIDIYCYKCNTLCTYHD